MKAYIEELRTGFWLTIGLDLGDKNSRYAFWTKNGEKIIEDGRPTNPAAIDGYFRQCPSSLVALR